MADEIKIKAPEVEQNINITVSGEEKLKSFTTTLNRIARDTQLQKYWKDQKSLIKGVIAAYADFKRISNETNATSLINNVNALKAIAGSDISGLFKNFDHISEQIERASSMVGRVVGEYSPENFKEAFSSFEAMRAYGLDMEEVFSRMSKTANVEELNKTISILEGELARAQSRAASATRELERLSSGEAFSEMRSELENVSNVLERVTSQAADEFRAFLTTNDIAEYDMFGDSLYYTYFEGIKNGSMTAKEAIAKFKAEFEYLLDVDASAGIGVEQFNRMSDKMDELLIKIEEVRKHISTISTSPLQAVASGLSENVQLTESQRMAMSNLSAEGNNLSSVFDILKGLISAGDVASDEVSKVHGSLADVLGVLRDIAGIDPTSLNSLGGALRMIGGLHNLNIDKTPLNNLAGALQNIGGMVSTPNLSTLSAVDLHGFSDLKVSKASLSNLASYLPEIAKIDVPSLINLSKVDLSNFNNLKISKSSVEGLSILAQSNSLIEQQAELIGLIKKEREEYTKVLEKQADVEKKTLGDGPGSNGGSPGDNNNLGDDLNKNRLSDNTRIIKEYYAALIQLNKSKGDVRLTENKEYVSQSGYYNNLAATLNKTTTAYDLLRRSMNLLPDDEKARLLTIITQEQNRYNAAVELQEEKERRAAVAIEDKNSKILESSSAKMADKVAVVDEGMKTALSTIEAVETKFNKLSSPAQGLTDAVSGLRAQFDAVQNATDDEAKIKAYIELEATIRRCNKEISNFNIIESSSAKMADKVAVMNEGLRSVSSEIEAIIRKRNKFATGVGFDGEKLFPKELANVVNESKNLYLYLDNVNRAASDEEKIIAYKKLLDAIKFCNKELSLFGTARSSETNRLSLLKQIEGALGRIQKAHKDWTAANAGATKQDYSNLSEYIKRLEDLKNSFDTLSEEEIKARLAEINTEFAESSRNIKAVGRNTKSLSDKFGGLAKKFASWLSVSQIIMKLYQALRKMVQVVVDIDTAMTELRKVTNETEAAYIKFLDKATERAKKLGTTISDTINATADFARLGYNLDEASTLSDAAVVYKNVGDGIESINDASASIISTMKAFGIEVEDVMSIVDRFNEVGNNFAISSKGVGDALLNSASAMAAANNTLDESIALITAANSVVQNPEKVGTALKTTSMFLRAAKTEAEEAGESTDGMAESVSALRKEILALTGNRVEIQIDKNTFKSSYEILRDLSKVWKDLSDITQANILEMIGGKRNSNVVAAILNNFEIAESVMESTANAAGSALAENEKYLQSIRGEISKFKAEFEELAVTLINAEFAKEVVRFGTGVLSILNSIADLIDKIGGLKTVLSSVVAGGLLFNLGGIGSQFAKLEDRARKLIAVFNRVPAVLRMYKNGTAATLLHTDRFTAALKRLGIAASKTQLAIGGLFAAITLGVMVYQAHKNALEEQRQAAINSAKSYEEAKDSIEGYEDKIRSLRESLKSNTISEHEAKEKREELISIQERLIDLFGDEADGINLVTGEIEDQIEAIKNLNKENWISWRQENYSANNNIVDNFTDYKPAEQRAILSFASMGISPKFYTEMETRVAAAIESGALKAKINKSYDIDGNLLDISFSPDTDSIYEAQEVYSELYRMAEEVGKSVFSPEDYESEMDVILQIFSNQLSNIKATISEEESAFNTLAEGVLSYSDEYKDVWEDALEAHERYSKALREDDRQGMNEAIAEMSEARNKLFDAFNKSFKTRDDLAAELYSNRFFDDFFSAVDSNEINAITELKSRFDSGLISVKEFREEVTKLKDNLLSAGGASSEVEEALTSLELDKVEKLSREVKSFINKFSGTSIDPQSLGRSMVDDFGEGNVNLTNRKKVQNEDGSYSTVASEWINDTIGGKEVAIHFTPILDGEFLNSNDINNYLDILLDGATSSSEILERDRNGLGIVLRVKEDFDFDTENAWGESLHLAQEEFYSAKEAAEELEKYIGEMTFEELKIAEELISTETFDSLDEFETRLNQINFAGAEMVNVLDFSDMFSGMNTAVDGLDNIISAMEVLNKGTALTKNQLSSLAMEYPKLLEQANLFTDGSIEGQKNLLNTILESKEAEHDAHIDAKISELNATNEVLKMQIDLENMRKDKVLEIEELMTNGKLDAEADYQKILNDIKDVEGSNFVTFEQGKLNVNKEALEDKLVQEGNSVEESKPIWEEAGNLIVESSYKGVNEGNKAWPKGLEKLRSWYNNKFLPFLENMSTNIKEAWSKEDVTIFDALKKSFSGSVEDIGDGSNVTLTTDIEETYTINGQSVNDWVSNYKETLDKRVEVINKQIEANKITIKNLESLKGLSLTDMYGSSSSVSGSSSGKSAVEEYQANIDAYYAAEKRLKEIIALHESLEKKLEHTNDLSEKIKITKELIEVYKDEAEAEQDLVEAKIDTIEANARALRKLGFDVIYDSDTNEFFIENLEHLNELTADSKGKYDSLQEATNALREETEKLIDTTEQLNDDNIEAAGSIEDLGYAVLEAKNNIIDYIEEIYGKQTEAYQKIIDLRKELIESAKDELDYEDEIAEKVKEIAELQTRIDQLSLDDSRSAQAERNTLMKELAEKQKELADTQSEHSTDAQLEALDKMAENFEKEKADEIELLKQTVDTSDELWSAFYDSILGKNVTIGESINSEIANAWMNAASAVKEYSASVGSIGGVGTVVTSVPKYHNGGVVDEANLNKDESLAILQKGEVVLNDGKQQSLYRIIDFQTELSKKLGVALNNTPLFGARPNFGELASRLADNVQNVSNSVVFEPHIEVVIQGGTNMSESSAKAYGEQIANATIDKLYSAFERRGINSTRGSRLKP